MDFVAGMNIDLYRPGETPGLEQSYSTQGAALSNETKQFEALQTKAEQSGATPKAVILSVPFPFGSVADRIRFVLRDSASGRLGSFDLPVTRIGPTTPSPGATASPIR